MYDATDDIVAVLKETGVLRKPLPKYRAQGTRLVNGIKASGKLIPELIPAWRTKGVPAEVSSSYQNVLYTSFSKTRANLSAMWRGEGYDPRALEVIAQDTMWDTGLYPVGPQAGGTQNSSTRIWPCFVPFTPEEVVWFNQSGPCSGAQSTIGRMGRIDLVSDG